MYGFCLVLFGLGFLFTIIALAVWADTESIEGFYFFAVCLATAWFGGANTFYAVESRATIESPLYYKIFEETGEAHFVFNGEIYYTKDYQHIKSPENVRIRTVYQINGRWFKDGEHINRRELVLVNNNPENNN